MYGQTVPVGVMVGPVDVGEPDTGVPVDDEVGEAVEETTGVEEDSIARKAAILNLVMSA